MSRTKELRVLLNRELNKRELLNSQSLPHFRCHMFLPCYSGRWARKGEKSWDAEVRKGANAAGTVSLQEPHRALTLSVSLLIYLPILWNVDLSSPHCKEVLLLTSLLTTQAHIPWYELEVGHGLSISFFQLCQRGYKLLWEMKNVAIGAVML